MILIAFITATTAISDTAKLTKRKHSCMVETMGSCTRLGNSSNNFLKRYKVNAL